MFRLCGNRIFIIVFRARHWTVYLHNRQVLAGGIIDRWSFAVNEFWTFRDNIYLCVFITFNFSAIPDRQFSSIQYIDYWVILIQSIPSHPISLTLSSHLCLWSYKPTERRARWRSWRSEKENVEAGTGIKFSNMQDMRITKGITTYGLKDDELLLKWIP
jgi:hypothetical protein